MKLTCPRCGKPHDGVDEQASGRVEAIRCACGTRIPVVAAASATGPTAGPRYDADAARHGLLIEEAEARALAARDPFLAAAVEDAPWGDFDVTMNFSTALPLPVPEKKQERAPARRETAAPPAGAVPPPPEAPPAPLEIPSAWIVPAAALAAFLAVGGGTALLLVPTPMLLSALASASSRLQGEAPPEPPLLPLPVTRISADVTPAPTLAPPGEAVALEPERQPAPATAPAPPRDGRTRTHTRLAARQRLAGQR